MHDALAVQRRVGPRCRQGRGIAHVRTRNQFDEPTHVNGLFPGDTHGGVRFEKQLVIRLIRA